MLHAIWASTARKGRRAEQPGVRTGRSLVGRVPRALRGQWFELSLAVAAGCAVGAGELIITGIGRLGGFAMMPMETGLVTPGRVPVHLSMALSDTLNLFGADVGAAQSGPQAVFAWLHAPGVALAAAAIGLTVWRVPGRADLISDVLAVGLVANVACFVASVIPATPFDAREMAAALPYGAVLAGRVFGPRLASPRLNSSRAPGRWRSRVSPAAPAHAASTPTPTPTPTRRGWRFRFRPGVAALVLAGGCQLAALGYEAAQPAAVSPEQALAGWLAARHLTTGLGTYTEGNITTLDSGGAVRLLTVSWHPPAEGGTVARLYQSSASWYDPRTAVRELRGHRTGRRYLRPHPAGRDPRPGRPARPDLPVRVVHDHGLEQEPARAARRPARSHSRRHRPPLTRGHPTQLAAEV